MRYDGLYLATVVTTVDAEKRFRSLVRVDGIHASDIPDEELPWAEYGSTTGRLRGNFFPYHRGDVVYVQFVGGKLSMPVIFGGRVSTANGVTDAPLTYQTDVAADTAAEDNPRWEMSDGAGNRIVLSERGRELHVLIESGGASVEVTRRDDSINIKAAGMVRVEGARVDVTAAVANISANDVNIDATNGDAQLRATDAIIVNTSPLTPLPSGKILIGGDAPRFRGIPMPPVIPGAFPRQAEATTICSQTVNIGAGEGGVSPPATTPNEMGADYDGVANLLPTLNINIRSIESVNIHTQGTVDVSAGLGATIRSGGPVTISGPSVHILSS